MEIAPNIIVPDQPAGPSRQSMIVNNIPNDDFNDGYDEICLEVLENAQDVGLCDVSVDSYMTTVGNKRVHEENTRRIKSKKARMDKANASGFVEVKSAHSRKIVWYYAKNLDNFENYISFLANVKPKLVELFRRKGSGYVVETIDGLLLTVYKYTPMGKTPNIGLPDIHFDNELNQCEDGSDIFNSIARSSYIQLHTSITKRGATIKPQNTDQYCFKWAILAKHVTGSNKHRVGDNYYQHENKYNFTGLSFPTPWSEVKIFEKNNPTVSINIYGNKKISQPSSKYPSHHIFPLKVVENEKADHFDLILYTEGEKGHYVYISNFSRLIRSQITKHGHSKYFCKRCFTSFDDQTLKYKLSGRPALEQHKLICGAHKPILPKMPDVGATLEFENWQHAQRHPFTIYADFEALLVKTNEKRGKHTTVIHNHKPMSYGFLVKASEDVPLELIERFNIPSAPVIYRGSNSREDVARHFLENIVDVGHKIEELLKTNTPIVMSDEDTRKHNSNKNCNF
ncbi:hypothetical protein QTP88_015532 [Uroleucon formosanum]